MARERQPPASGQNELLEYLYTRYRKVLRQYFARRTRSYEDADDLTQDVLVRVAQTTAGRQLDNHEAFLFVAAANMLRDRNRHREVVERHVAQYPVLSENVEVLSPEHVLIGKQSLEALSQALSQLNDRAREVLMLHRLDGMTYAEIARRYGVSVSTIEKDIIKALAHLARHSDLRD